MEELNQEQSALPQENYNAFLISALGDEFTQVSEPGPRTLRVRSAITEVHTSDLVLNWFTGLFILWPLAAMVNAERATIWNGIGAMTRIGHAGQAAEEAAGWVWSLVRR